MTEKTIMPDFSGFESDIKSDKDLEELNEAEKPNFNKSFEPGLHNLKITGVELTTKECTDPTWKNVKYEFEGTQEGQTIKHWVMIPTKSTRYGEKKTLYVFNKLVNFCQGLGLVDITSDTVGTLKTHFFGGFDSQVGKLVDATIGYTKYHLKYLPEDKTYNLMTPKYEAVVGTDGQPIAFNGYDEAKAHCLEKGLTFNGFPEILDFKPAAKPIKTAKAKKETTDF